MWYGFLLDLYFLIPEATLFSSIEEFFVGKRMLAIEWIRSDESSTIFSDFSDEFPVYLIDLCILQTIPIGRIGYDDTSLDRASYKVLCHKSDIIENSGSFGISLCYREHCGIDITRGNVVFSTWIYLASCGILDGFQHHTIEELEFFDPKMSIESWGNVASNHHCLNSNRPRSTEGIQQRRSVFPICKCDQSCGEIFFDWSLSSLPPVATLVEGIARDVKEDMSDIIDNQDEYMHLDSVGKIRSIECRKYGSLSDALDRRDALEGRSRRRCFNNDAFFSSEIISPLEFSESIIECIEVFSLHRWELDIDSIRKTTPHQEFIHILLSSGARYESILGLDIGASEPFAFSFDERFESRLTGEYEPSSLGGGVILHVWECIGKHQNSK